MLHAVRRAVRAVDGPLVLAVSGGLDSMALLVGMAREAPDRVAAVATFDHGTGPDATAAAAFVERAAATLGCRVVAGRMGPTPRSSGGREAAWRRARHAFLAEVAAPLGARIVTAHTRDDQVETVLMRELRGAGARGLAGLFAPSPIVRPFLHLPRRTLHAFLARAEVDWMEDPSNGDPAFLRNRVRHDLLPALRRATPGVDETLLAIGRDAARWREGMDRLAARMAIPDADDRSCVSVATRELRGYSRNSLMVLWGSLAGRVGLALDRRGTERLATFIMKEPDRGEVPLSGGWTLEVDDGTYRLRRGRRAAAPAATLPVTGAVEWGRFRFLVGGRAAGRSGNAWDALLPADASLEVRAWRAGDRLGPAAGQGPRRVARYLSDAGMHGTDRRHWPVIVAGPAREVVWIPGVRRSDAATERSGRPVRLYVCERIAP